jgi:hypothetical protein
MPASVMLEDQSGGNGEEKELFTITGSQHLDQDE